MADVILNRRELKSIMQGGALSQRYSEYIDFAYLPASLAIDVIEKEKKESNTMPSILQQHLSNLKEGVFIIPLSSQGLLGAMKDPEFSEKYINREGNPIEFATEASIYEFDGWWDKVELMESYNELSWP